MIPAVAKARIILTSEKPCSVLNNIKPMHYTTTATSRSCNYFASAGFSSETARAYE
jgi:hypothetical protein